MAEVKRNNTIHLALLWPPVYTSLWLNIIPVVFALCAMPHFILTLFANNSVTCFIYHIAFSYIIWDLGLSKREKHAGLELAYNFTPSYFLLSQSLTEVNLKEGICLLKEC